MRVFTNVRVGGGWVASGGGVEVSAAARRDMLGVAGVDYVPGLLFTGNSVGVFADVVLVDVEADTTEAGSLVPNQISLVPGTYENKRFWGDVKLTGAGTFKFVNCEFAGMRPDIIEAMGRGLNGATSAQRGAMRNYNTSRFAEFVDCTFNGRLWSDVRGVNADVYARRLWNANPKLVSEQDAPGTVQSWQSPWGAAISGCNVTLRRCEVTGWQDLLVLIGDNWLVEGSWIHGTWWGCRGVGSSSDFYSHSDVVQAHQGKHWVFRGNVIGGRLDTSGFDWGTPGSIGYNAGDSGYTSGGILVQQETTSDPLSPLWVDDVQIVGNVIAGGLANANLHYKNGNTLSGMTFTDNLFLARPTTTPRNDNGSQLFVSSEVLSGATFARNYVVDWAQLLGGGWPSGGNGTPAPVSDNNT